MKAKDIKHMKAYKELQEAVILNVADVDKRPAALGLLVKRFIARCIDHNPDLNIRGDLSIINSFTWRDTAEGEVYWSRIYNGMRIDDLNPCPIKGKGQVKAKVAKPAPKKKVGWWV